jgi:hypothetical protein
MKLTIAFISTLAALASADYLEQNTLCGDNKEFASNCRDGRYHIVSNDAGSIHFGCSVKANNPLKYSNPDCSFGLNDGTEEAASSRATCNTVGGTVCPTHFLNGETVNYCVILSKDVAAFKENCKAAGGAASDHNVDLSYGILVDGCEGSA